MCAFLANPYVLNELDNVI